MDSTLIHLYLSSLRLFLKIGEFGTCFEMFAHIFNDLSDSSCEVGIVESAGNQCNRLEDKYALCSFRILWAAMDYYTT